MIIQEIRLVAGDYNPIAIDIVKSDGSPPPFSGYSVELVLKSTYRSLPGAFILTRTAVPIDPAKGEFLLHLEPEDTAYLKGIYNYALRIVDTQGRPRTLTLGQVNFVSV